MIIHNGIEHKVWVIAESPTGTGSFLPKDSTRIVDDFFKAGGCTEYAKISMDEKYSYSKVFEYRNELLTTIKLHRPNVVLLLGENLMYVATNTKSQKYFGHKVFSDHIGVKVISTHKPQSAVRQRYVKKDENPGQFEALLNIHIQNVCRERHTHEMDFAETELVVAPSYEDCMQYLEEAHDASILSFDIEIIAPYQLHAMDCIGLCTSPEKAICIPFYNPHQLNFTNYFDTLEQQVAVFNALKTLLESDVPKVAQNSKFDIAQLQAHYGIKTRNLTWDTLLAQHNLYVDLPKDLGTLIHMYTKLEYQKQLIKTGRSKDRWVYCAADAIANIHIMQGQYKEMAEYNILDHFLTITMPAVEPLIEMEIAGIAVDEEKWEIARKAEYEVQDTILEILNKAFPKPIHKIKSCKDNYNPSSAIQKRILFYEILGLKKRYSKSSITTDKHALLYWMESKDPIVAALAEMTRKYSLSKSMSSSLEQPLRNGRIHCSYGLGEYDEEAESKSGTDTGRLSSRASSCMNVYDGKKWVDSGCNLQNRKAGIQREGIIPDEGELFLGADLSSAEAYLIAQETAEPFMLEMLARGEKLYTWLQKHCESAFPERLEKLKADIGDKKLYTAFKSSTHAIHYGAEPGILCSQHDIPMDVANYAHSLYHRKFPGVNLRMVKIRTELHKTKILRSVFGRHKVFMSTPGRDMYNNAYAWKSQSAIGELTLYAMSRIYYRGQAALHYPKLNLPWMFPALNTHDGIMTRFKEGEEVAVRKSVHECFYKEITDNNITLRIPIETWLGRNFNESYEIENMGYNG